MVCQLIDACVPLLGPGGRTSGHILPAAESTLNYAQSITAFINGVSSIEARLPQLQFHTKVGDLTDINN